MSIIRETRVEEVIRFVCEECREDMEEGDCCNDCGDELDFDCFYCNQGLHLCTDCGEKIIKEEEEEKENLKPLPGQLNMFDSKEDIK